MHFPLALLLFALSGADPLHAEPSSTDTGSSVSMAPRITEAPVLGVDPADNERRGPRADPSTQMLYSTLGGGLGILGGAFLGGSVAAGLSSESDGWAAIGNVIFGVGIGALAGGTAGATWGAIAARPKQRNRSFVPTALGGFGGLALGFVSGITIFNAIGSDNNATTALCFLAIPALGAGAGATLVDQWTTPDRISSIQPRSTLGLAPWMPREGLLGLRVTIPTEI